MDGMFCFAVGLFFDFLFVLPKNITVSFCLFVFVCFLCFDLCFGVRFTFGGRCFWGRTDFYKENVGARLVMWFWEMPRFCLDFNQKTQSGPERGF